MQLSFVWRACRTTRASFPSCRRLFTTIPGLRAPEDLSRTRNIGIIAHIDAGKTTTTERMLYYSGYTRRIGDVDEGSTVTDFLPAERARGITIQSAAISFNWPPSQDQKGKATGVEGTEPAAVPMRSSVPHNINLIDTPGHADFTFEVLRSLRILDGAVCILDGVAGVEAQTEKVWTQANTYRIPRIVFVNKLDRDGAAFARTVKEVGVRLHGWPAVCQIPWWTDAGKLLGVGDAVNLRGLRWKEGTDGKDFGVVELAELEKTEPKFAEEIKKARTALVECLSEHDDEMVELFLEHDENHLSIPGQAITESLRRCVLQSPQMVIPIFAGASFRNVGVQPLLDAVVDLLPSPDERPDPEISIGGHQGGLEQLLSGNLAIAPPPEEPVKGQKGIATKVKRPMNVASIEACALAFKVVNDAKRGVLVYFRVYSGSISRGAQLYNTNLGVTEKAFKLLKMYANDAVEVTEIPAGQIGVIAGLKYARTGDTLISYAGINLKNGPPTPVNTLQLRPITVPPPVFFTSVEPNSLSEEKNVSDGLSILLREDPSLHVHVDPESGQTHLSGMGELHLEIARDRLIKDMKIKASTGAIEIGYRETVMAPSEPVTEVLDREIAGKTAKATCIASVTNIESSTTQVASESDYDAAQTTTIIESNRVVINHPGFSRDGVALSSDSPALPQELPFSTIISALQTGAAAALARGPTYRFPVHSTEVVIDLDAAAHLFPDTTATALSQAARGAVTRALRASAAAAPTVIMEPVMLVTITVNESDLGSIVHDISSARGGQIVSLDENRDGADVLAAQPDGGMSYDDLPAIDASRIYAPPDPFDPGAGFSATVHSPDAQRHVTARVPLKEMVGYLRHLRSLTKGRGTFVMSVDRFERMGGQRMKTMLAELRGGFQ